MVATGYGYRSTQDLSQVVLVNSTKSCSSLPPYPLKLTSANGGVLKGSPLICGGYHEDQTIEQDNTVEIFSSCYIYEKSSNTWILHANMKTKRYGHSSAWNNDFLLVTGGLSDGEPLATTELIFSNGSVTHGPNLPAPRAGHCMVTLDDGKFMILGGYPSSFFKSVLILNPETFTFTNGPSLLNKRDAAGCTHFRSPLHNNR